MRHKIILFFYIYSDKKKYGENMTVREELLEIIKENKKGNLFNESIENLDQYEVYDELNYILDLVEQLIKSEER